MSFPGGAGVRYQWEMGPDEGGSAEGVPAPPSPVRVLLVDDEPEVRALLKRALTRAPGLDVVGEASDGAEALRIAADLAPDLVVLDLNMPGMGGEEALPLLREQLPEAKIAVVSGDQPSGGVSEAADLCLKKGGSVRELAENLVRLVRP